jgi:uncharacterized protein
VIVMLHSTATVATDAPDRYAKQLLSHLGRKNAVAEGDRLTFSYGTGTVRPGDGVLVLIAEAPDADGLAHVQDVLARHLERFGARHELVVTWDTA